MLFLTFNDPPSGIYYSQVTDVCRFLEKKFSIKIRLLAFISLRKFFFNRKKIQAWFPGAIVLPMFPTLHLWKWNSVTLFFVLLFFGKQTIIARGVFAAQLALFLKKTGFVKKVIFDVRGAVAAEAEEYAVIPASAVRKKISFLEKDALLHSDFRIAVSEKLVRYWQERYKYFSSAHSVIPCTLHSSFLPSFPSEDDWLINRKKFGYTQNDIVCVYCGSSAGWQTLPLVDDFLYALLSRQPEVKVLLLMKNPGKMKIITAFSKRVNTCFLPEENVASALLAADYGILLREDTTTNRVSSPVKFAEYLVCGLPVLISENIGDYSSFTEKERCGIVIRMKEWKDGKMETPVLTSVFYERKKELSLFARKYFSKESFTEEYRRVIEQRD